MTGKKSKHRKADDGAGVVVELEAEKKRTRKKNIRTVPWDESTNFSQLDERNALAGAEGTRSRMKTPRTALAEPPVLDSDKQIENKKKLKGVLGVEQNKVRSNIETESASVNDEEDMLFNFYVEPEGAHSPQSKALATCHRREDQTGMMTAHNIKEVLLRAYQDNQEMINADEDNSRGRNERKKRKKQRRKVDEKQSAIHVVQTDATDDPQGKTPHSHPLKEEHQMRESKQLPRANVMGMQHSNLSHTGVSSRPTFSMAVAGSIVDNAQSLDLATMLAGQIARAATIFRLDEIVVFDDYDGVQADVSEEVSGLFMVRILKYLEVPQYLRKALVPMHQSLSSVGKLPPLDAPHHLRKHEWRPFREGVVVDSGCSLGADSHVDVGLGREVRVGQALKPGLRVTVAMGQSKADGNVLQVVDHEAARQAGFYWGYTVRYANCLSAVFDECPFEGKYDFCIGTSEHGDIIRSADLVIPKCKHVLVAFGGLSGLEESFELDKKLKNRLPKTVFDLYLNTCPDQGSRTIRTEEAILISLQFLQAAVQKALGFFLMRDTERADERHSSS